MKALIITVGTRQVGWQCSNGLVRSLGADGDRNHPKHIDQLYTELGQERGSHSDGKNSHPWGVRHLGEQVYQHCAAQNDFSNIQLLLDEAIIEEHAKPGLDHIILWGTDQPETVSWQYRRADTIWLAKLMAKKIEQTWPAIKVSVWCPVVPANQPNLIRKEIEAFLLDYAQQQIKADAEEGMTLMIQTKGSAPAIANTLEICAAALIRQCSVVQVTPVEPDPLFKEVGAFKTAQSSVEFDEASLGAYFWPLERSRIQSAWQRGDFAEAKVWLGAHRDRHETLYDLADHLSLASNGQISETFQQIQLWLSSADLEQRSTPAERQEWSTLLMNLMPEQPTHHTNAAQAWENLVLIERLLWRGNYTRAFLWFSQTLERFLYLRGKEEDWQAQGALPHKKYLTLGNWIHGWREVQNIEKRDKRWKTLYGILEIRNELVHQGRPTTLLELEKLWEKSRMMPVPVQANRIEPMQLILTEVTAGCFPIPQKTLLRSLYNWGYQKLQQ